MSLSASVLHKTHCNTRGHPWFCPWASKLSPDGHGFDQMGVDHPWGSVSVSVFVMKFRFISSDQPNKNLGISDDKNLQVVLSYQFLKLSFLSHLCSNDASSFFP